MNNCRSNNAKITQSKIIFKQSISGNGTRQRRRLLFYLFFLYLYFIFASIIAHGNNENEQKSNQYNIITILYRQCISLVYNVPIKFALETACYAGIDFHYTFKFNSPGRVYFYFFLFFIIYHYFPNCDDEYFTKPSIIQSLV